MKLKGAFFMFNFKMNDSKH